MSVCRDIVLDMVLSVVWGLSAPVGSKGKALGRRRRCEAKWFSLLSWHRPESYNPQLSTWSPCLGISRDQGRSAGRSYPSHVLDELARLSPLPTSPVTTLVAQPKVEDCHNRGGLFLDADHPLRWPTFPRRCTVRQPYVHLILPPEV